MNFHTSRIPFRKIPAINASFAPKYEYLQGWPLKFGQDVKIFQPKYSNVKQEQIQVNRERQANQRMMNGRKKQFKSFEIPKEEISFQIMSFYFQI